ncbi:Dyp-type peroxidase [Longispora albida]|uniref:Dyp-type peroxidase n=1 Tax=Longispora albida TaxID=203523 RepID=UPI00035F2BE8|nr:Dyp-type peroxidase [Longispora albida]
MRRFAVLLAVAAVLVLATPAPAGAHTVGGVGATNFRTTLSALVPGVAGAELRVIENGSRLELRNTGAAEVTVRGYADEPYLRVGPDGVFENQQSPATYLNRSRFGQVKVPAGVNPKNPPVWKKSSAEPVHRWHDHRIHWMLTTLPAAVADQPDQPHRVTEWSITITQGSVTHTATGTLDWVPGPQPWGWLAVAVAGTLLVGTLGLLRRPYPAMIAATLVMLVADVVHAAGIALVTPGSVIERVGAFIGGDLLQVTCWLVLAAALFFLRKKHSAGVWLAAGGSAMIALTSGVADAPVLWRSSAPFAWDITLNRATLSLTIAFGFGLLLALPVFLWRQKRVVADAEDTVAVPRRRVLELAGAAGLGGVAGAAVGFASAPEGERPGARDGGGQAAAGTKKKIVSHSGPRQAGITEPRQAYAWVGGFDLVRSGQPKPPKDLIRQWMQTSAQLAAGGAGQTMIGAGLGATGLTVTIGYGPSLFEKLGMQMPAALEPLPAFPGDALDPARSDGDLGLVIAADDALAVQEAVRTLTRLAAGVAVPRWGMSGFASSAGGTGTQRNLMGQLDGTNNPKPADADFAQRVFAADGWMRDGSYLVVRRIRMLLGSWEGLDRAAQGKVIGRGIADGAPLSGGTEFTPANFGATKDGQLAIPGNAHVRLAAPAFNNGAAMLRRGFNYADAPDDSGLLFLAYQADPRTGFVPVQRKLASSDALNSFIRHESSALFAVPGVAGLLGVFDA